VYFGGTQSAPEFQMTSPAPEALSSRGEFLAMDETGKIQPVTVGTDQGSNEEVLNKVSRHPFLIDLRTARQPASSWLAIPRLTRSIGVQEFSLQACPERFGYGVVVGVGDGAEGGQQPGTAGAFGEGPRGELLECRDRRG
jgi:erythromycin esterase